MAGVRVCERCGTKMPFGVRRRVVDGKKVCGGCASGREGRPLTNHGAYQAPYATRSDRCPSCGEGRVEFAPEGATLRPGVSGPLDDWWYCPACGASGREDALGWEDDEPRYASRTAAPVPPQFLQDPKPTPPPFEAAEDEEPLDGEEPGDMPPPPPGGQQPGVPTPGTPGGGIGSFAPDRESDKVVRVCPFCGSGQIVGQSDGSIECGHEGVVFLVEVLPKHPFQPLVDEQGQPFEMTVEGDEQLPEIGIARAEGPAPAAPFGEDPQPGDGPGDDEGDDDLPPFLKGGALYVTDEGTALNEDAYIAHLAQRFG